MSVDDEKESYIFTAINMKIYKQYSFLKNMTNN